MRCSPAALAAVARARAAHHNAPPVARARGAADARGGRDDARQGERAARRIVRHPRQYVRSPSRIVGPGLCYALRDDDAAPLQKSSKTSLRVRSRPQVRPAEQVGSRRTERLHHAQLAREKRPPRRPRHASAAAGAAGAKAARRAARGLCVLAALRAPGRAVAARRRRGRDGAGRGDAVRRPSGNSTRGL